MYIKFYFFLGLLLIMSAKVSYSQELKDLREKPEARILNADTVAKIQIKPVSVPIPQLGLKVNYWKHWTKFGVNANQASFSDSWNAGGVNSLALSGLVWHKSDYTRDRFNFVSELDLRYGKVWNKNQLPKKNNDRIFWDNKIAHRFTDKWSIYFSLTFESQFDVVYRYGKDKVSGEEIIIDTVSAFMAPGYLTESLGIEYKLKTFSLRLGTGTARQTFLLDDRIAPKLGEKEVYGVQPGRRFRNDLAFQITANWDKNLSNNLNLKARYNLFADYKDVTDPDQRLDVTLTAKITKLVSVTANGVMFYDSQQNSKIQFSQALAMGLIYSLPK